MKWFNELDKKTRKYVNVSLFFSGLAFFIVFELIKQLETLFAFLFVGVVVFAIVLNISASKYDKNKEKEKEEKARPKYIATATESPKNEPKETPKGYISTDTMFFRLKDGYEVKEETTLKITKVRGVYYNNIYEGELNEGDEVHIAHNPTDKYPESTEVYCDDTLIGHLMAEMASDFVRKYGEHFEFSGTVIEVDTGYEDKYDTDSDFIVTKAIIQFEVPNFKKISTKKKSLLE